MMENGALERDNKSNSKKYEIKGINQGENDGEEKTQNKTEN